MSDREEMGWPEMSPAVRRAIRPMIEDWYEGIEELLEAPCAFDHNEILLICPPPIFPTLRETIDRVWPQW